MAAMIFDYSSVPAETKSKLIWYAVEINRQSMTHVKTGIEMGKLLSEARELSGKAFREWVQRECGHSLRTAYNYIAAWENFGECANFAQLELSAMYTLTKNEEAKKRALKLVGKGHRITHELAKQLVADATERAVESDGDEQESEPETIIDVEAVASAASESEPEPESSEEYPVVETPIKTPVDYGICPNCKGKKWTVDEFGATCSKCNHPHGESLGDVDDDRIRIQKSKTVKTAEALMRAFDDLQSMRPNSGHDEAMALCKKLLVMGRGW